MGSEESELLSERANNKTGTDYIPSVFWKLPKKETKKKQRGLRG